MTKVFLDSDVLLDLLMKRQESYLSMREIFIRIQQKKVHAFTSSLIIANIYYLLRKTHGTKKSKSLLKKLLSFLTVLPTAEKNIVHALENNNISDFEDAIQYSIASNEKMECILTRNIKDYKKSALPIFTPEMFILEF